MSKLFKSLYLNKFGWIELIIAFYPILMGYQYGRIILGVFIPLILSIIILLRNKVHFLSFRPLLLFALFVIGHDILWLIILPSVPSYFINSLTTYIIYFGAIFIIQPVIKQEKLEGSINWIAIMCLGGMFYHAILVLSGHSISPIKLPFMLEMSETSRLYEEGIRPCSFFWEPQSYASFMIVPLFYALNRKNYIWSLIIAVSIIMSTSTTGIVMLIIMFTSVLFTHKLKLFSKIIIIISFLSLGYFLLNSQYADASLNKLENTDLKTTSRTANGPLMAFNMPPLFWVTGIPYANATDYYYAEHISDDIIVSNNETRSVFVSGFWLSIIRFGIIGLALLVNLYIAFWKRSREMVPLVLCLLASLFSNPDFIGAFVFPFIVMLTLSRPKIALHKKEYSYGRRD